MIPDSVITILPMAALFGLSAGLSPGPLLTLVISETIRRNWMAGIRVALSPLITDLPIILATWFVFNKLSGFSLILGIISVAGGTYFTWLGFETFKSNNIQTEGSGPESESLRRGIIANFLNPNPYIFWLTAGIPTAYKASEEGISVVVLYFMVFYLMLIGSKSLVAVLVDRSKVLINSKIYLIVMKFLGIVLLFCAILFFYDGIRVMFHGISIK
jgi:threonine/homoserine/homoserine lactone efflux protein